MALKQDERFDPFERELRLFERKLAEEEESKEWSRVHLEYRKNYRRAKIQRKQQEHEKKREAKKKKKKTAIAMETKKKAHGKKRSSDEDEDGDDEDEDDADELTSLKDLSLSSFVPKNANLTDASRRALEEVTEEARKIGVHIVIAEPWKQEPLRTERLLCDNKNNVVFQIYKKKHKRNHIALIVGNDSTIQYLETIKKLNVMMFSVTEPRRTVESFECGEVRYRYYHNKLPVTYTKTSMNYVVMAINDKLSIWKTNRTSISEFFAAHSNSHMTQFDKEAIKSSWPHNPFQFGDHSFDMVWFKPHDSHFGRTIRSIVVKDVRGDTTRWNVEHITKGSSTLFDFIPSNYQMFLGVQGRSAYSYDPKAIANWSDCGPPLFVRGQLSHHYFADWHQIIHIRIYSNYCPLKYDNSALWNLSQYEPTCCFHNIKQK
eukprot:TRINITY_DN5210_c0_g1_i1.p1 TRINITY_DN5210_c0_g1~~TRINITY_DN5210_c0_g1_i1.p1  ORF type:complete len:431 (-),score=110.65 TRINITY_DN5210_c0_g1_i1:101-1393(-)